MPVASVELGALVATGAADQKRPGTGSKSGRHETAGSSLQRHRVVYGGIFKQYSAHTSAYLSDYDNAYYNVYY